VNKSNIIEIASRLAKSKRLLIITGAGISADSGLPTYRGLGGLYEDSATEDNISVEEALSGQMLKWRPEVCWKYLQQIEIACRQAEHNRAHQVIYEMERYFEEILVLTQNIDGFHRSAGSKHVVEVHGNLQTLRCMICDFRESRKNWKNLKIPPVCPKCGGALRPDVVLFGEMLPDNALNRVNSFISSKVDMCFSIGTTSLFEYIAWPFIQTGTNGAYTVEINPCETNVSEYAKMLVREKSALALDKIWDEFIGG